ncbi:MAG: site-specific integrase [Pseudomonadota bacterium]
MSVQLKKGTWYVHFRPFGTLIKLALPECQGKRHAMSAEIEIINALRSQDYRNLSKVANEACTRLFVNQSWEIPAELQPAKAKPPPIEATLWNAIQLFVKSHYYAALKHPNRYQIFFFHLVHFFRKDCPMKDIWTPQIHQYRMQRVGEGASNSTVNKEVGGLSKLFRNLIDYKILTENPCRLVESLSEKSGLREVYIGLDDVNSIMDGCSKWYADIIWTAYLTGMRRGEIVNLTWKNVSVKKRLITLHAADTKESKAKRIPIHSDLIELFERLGKIRSLSTDSVFTLNGLPIKVQSCQRPWDRSLDKLEWEGSRPTPHDLRHTWNVNARRSGLDYEIRQSIMGHADRMKPVGERYGFISDEELVAAIDKFTYDQGLTQILVVSKAKK